MKSYLLLLLTILYFIGAKAQNPVIINQPYDFQKWVKVKDSLRAARIIPDSTLQLPTGCGVPSGTASLKGANRKRSAIFRDSCGKKTYIFEPTDSTWSEIGGAQGWVSVLDYGAKANDTLTDYTTNIQAALNSGARTVLIPTGLYILTNSIKINSNQTLMGYGAKLIRKAAIDEMIINGSNGSIGGYEADSNMSVLGISFEGNGINYASSPSGGTTLMVFGHAKNITIRDCDFTNTYNFHLVELNACKNVLVDRNNFHDAFTQFREMLQIDLALGSGVFPWFGPYDSTACDDIVIQNCIFTRGDIGVGSHSLADKYPHKNITVKNCYFENLRLPAISPYNYNNFTAECNTITNCLHGIIDNVVNNNPYRLNRDYRIINNNITNLMRPDVYGTANTEQGIAIGFDYVPNLIIYGNIIDSTRGNAIDCRFCDTVFISDNHITDYGMTSDRKFGITAWGTQNFRVLNNSIKTGISTDCIVIRDTLFTPKNGFIDGNIINKPNLLGDYYQFSQYTPLQCSGCFIGKNVVNDTVITNTVSISSNYTMGGTESVVKANTTSNTINVTMNPGIIPNEGITFFRSGSNMLLLTPTTGTINGQSSLRVDSSATVRTDGINYYTTGIIKTDTIGGGTSPGDSITIIPTSNSTFSGSLGKVLLGSSQGSKFCFFFQNNNDRLGIGTTSPAFGNDIHIKRDVNDNVGIRIENTNTNSGAFQRVVLANSGGVLSQLYQTNTSTVALGTNMLTLTAGGSGGLRLASTGGDITLAGSNNDGTLEYARFKFTTGSFLFGTNTESLSTGRFQIHSRSSFDSLMRLNNVTYPISSYNVLVHGLTDSGVYQIPVSDLIGGSITGSGTSGRIAYWNGSTSLTSNANFLFNGSVFSTGTTNTQGQLNVGGSKDLSSSGAQSYFAPATYTNQTTPASSTASPVDINLIGSPTIASANTNVTYPFVSSLAIVAPTVGTNSIITKSYALRLEASAGNNANLGVDGFIDGITQIRTSGSGASIAAGAGAGTGPSTSVTGGDAAGKIDITTGTSPSTSATVVTITFNAGYAVAPTVILTPGNAAAAALTGATQVFISGTGTTNFVITSGSSALSASTQYIWYYHAIQ